MGWKSSLLFIPAVAVGIGGFLALKGCGAPPAKREVAERSTSARVIGLPEGGMDVVPRAVAYGTVRARRNWRAVSQVTGRITEMDDELRAGAFVAKGAQLLQIDPTDYEVEARRAEAQLATLDAQLAQLEERERQYNGQGAIERRSLDLARKDLARSESLAEQGFDAAAERDQKERDVLRQQQAVQTLEDSIRLLPAQRQELAANREAQAALLDRARLDIDRCRVTAPFSIRISSVDVEMTQVVTQGQVLLTAAGIDVAEVAAPFVAARIQPAFVANELPEIPDDPGDLDIGKLFKVTAIVRMTTGAHTFDLPARVTRIETILTETRTVPIVVAVDKPYANVVPGKRPPLAAGMYVEVELRGQPKPGRVAVPLSAIRGDGFIHVVDADNRLRIRPTTVQFSQGDLAVIDSGPAAGERLVVSDLVPAIEGMLITPVEDADALERLQAAARGDGPVR